MRTSTEGKRVKTSRLIVAIVFFIGLFIGYLWGKQIDKPPYAVSLGHYNFIEVLQKDGGQVYKFGLMDGGSYEYITDISPDSDDYPYWANPEKSPRIIRKKIR